MMAIAIVTGSGLGYYSTDSAFMGLSQAAGMIITGLAMFGGAKYDEMVARKEERKQNGSRENDIMEQAFEAFRSKIQNSDIGNTSRSEAVRQARLAHDTRMEKPNKVEKSRAN